MKVKVSKDTLYDFEKFLEDVNMVIFLKKYSKSIKKRETALPKSYVVDNALYSFTTYKYDVGYLLESFVFQELIKRGYQPNKNLYYLNENGYEIDFVLLEKEKVKKLIQVSYILNKDDVKKREIESLTKISKNLKCKDLLIITWDYENKEKIKNTEINFIPLWKWLIK
jgi:hypothetical protein